MSVITRVEKHNSQIVTLTIGDPPFSTWKPGQFLLFSVREGETWAPEHVYTISSAPEEGEVRITVKAAGPSSTRLQNAVPGMEVRIRGPMGHFCKDADHQPRLTLIAGGIGITPFLSLLRHMMRAGTKSQIVLLWANNTANDIIHREELAAIAEQIGARILHFLWKDEDTVNACPCDDGQTCRSGLLNAATLAEHADLEHAEVYLCGPPVMHRMTMDIIRSLGVDPARIHTEIMNPAPTPKAPASKPAGG